MSELVPEETSELETTKAAQVSIPAEHAPTCLEDVFADLQGFGLEEFEEILTIDSGTKKLQIRIANISTDDDLTSILAVEGQKGYSFFQEVKAEILSRAVTWINGVDLRKLKGKDRLVTDPSDGKTKDFQVVLRNTIKGWAVEDMQVLWKVLMVHSQSIENRLFESFPDAAVLTDVERRYRDRIEREIEEATSAAIQEQVTDLLADDPDTEPEVVAS